jgi:predicted NUDIX family phosphoesterase
MPESSNFLEAAERVLRHLNKPLTASEITEESIRLALLESKGATPAQSMKARLSIDIKHNRSSRFCRAASGLFALVEWGGKFGQYSAKPFLRNPTDEDILVIPRTKLLEHIKGIGITRSPDQPNKIFQSAEPMLRSQAEEDFSVVQLVSLYIVSHNKFFLTFKRTKRLPEQRLHGVYSVGFGGHLNPDDAPPLFAALSSEEFATYIQRELNEELVLKDVPDISFVGLLYDESREVSKQHIGLVYNVRLTSPNYEIGERGFLMDSKLESLSDILSRLSDFENWSEMIVRDLLIPESYGELL